MKKLIATILSLLFLNILNAQLNFSMSVTNVTSTNYTVECWVQSTNTSTQIDTCSFGVSFSNSSNLTGVDSFSLGANYSTYTISMPSNSVVNIIPPGSLIIVDTMPELLWTIVYTHNGSSSYVSDITLTKIGTWSPGSNLDTDSVVISSQVLPITLSSFTVDGNEIKWETSSECNNKMFIIETSKDGKNWDYLYECVGAGNSCNTIEYSYTDPNQYTELVYYRLKQVDYNGKFSYSNICLVNHGDTKHIVKYYLFNFTTLEEVSLPLDPNKIYIKTIDDRYDSKIFIIKN